MSKTKDLDQALQGMLRTMVPGIEREEDATPICASCGTGVDAEVVARCAICEDTTCDNCVESSVCVDCIDYVED